MLFLFVETKYAIFYAIYCFVLWLVLKQPKYKGKSKMIKPKNLEQFYDEILGFEEDQLVVGLKAE